MTAERRRDDPRFGALSGQIEELNKKHDALSDKIEHNTQMTEEIRSNTAGIVETWQSITGGLKVLAALAKAAKYLSYFAMAVSAIGAAWYTATHWGAASPGGLKFPPDGS